MQHLTRKRLLIAAGCLAGLVLLGYLIYLAWGDPAYKLAGSQDPNQRLQAIEMLRARSSDKAQETVKGLTRDPDTRVAVNAVKALGETDRPENKQMLKDILAADNAKGQLRGAAAAALGNFKDTAPPVLTNALNDTDPSVRAGAALGLSRLRPREAVPQLIERLSDPDPNVRVWAVTALNRILGVRFDFDAQVPPEQQQQKIEYIKRLLRERKIL